MNKKLVSTFLALAMALTLVGCGQKNAAQPAATNTGSEPAPASGTTEPKSEPQPDNAVWSYTLTTENTEGEYKNDDGVLLATVSCERPVLSLSCEGGAQNAEPPKDMQKVCDVFNRGIDEVAGDMPTAESLGADAQLQYNEMPEEYRESFYGYSEELAVESTRISGSLLETMFSSYGYWGGAHGGMSYINLHFDLETGSFFGLADLTDNYEGLKKMLADDIINQIYEGGENEYLFDDFEDTVRNSDDYNFSIGEDGITVIFGQYELAAYVYGILEYQISDGKLSRFLNERGERLLAPSPEAKVLGNFYEADEMWYWFEGLVPTDYNDKKTAQVNGEDMIYYHVDLPGINSIGDLRNKMLTRLSEELVEARLASSGTEAVYPLFKDIDGGLYMLPAGRGTDMYIDSVDYVAKLNADGKGGNVIATITWRDYDEEKSEWVLTGEKSDVEFPFELTDGGAVFSGFSTIW
ncbi:MAG: DUF3298 domain-containing protein [Oscillospiraceae bacterium]|nr:DUF3298 domain-containing protein [Oscillospiraceae bacterium]